MTVTVQNVDSGQTTTVEELINIRRKKNENPNRVGGAAASTSRGETIAMKFLFLNNIILCFLEVLLTTVGGGPVPTMRCIREYNSTITLDYYYYYYYHYCLRVDYDDEPLLCVCERWRCACGFT